MSVPAPHFHLFSTGQPASGDRSAGRWRFVLRSADGQPCLEATDNEPESSAERLQLLAIVRGLEALDQPARVTLLNASRSIRRGLAQGLELWRENDWQWERYGQWTPVKNGDLWQRIDRAMQIHAIDCRELDELTTDDLAPPPNRPKSKVQSPKLQSKNLGPWTLDIGPGRAGRTLRIDPAPAQQLHPDSTENDLRSAQHWPMWLAKVAGWLGRVIAPPKPGERPAKAPPGAARRVRGRSPMKVSSP